MSRKPRPHQVVGGVTLKECSRCEALLSLASFSRRTAAYDGLQSTCRACQSAVQADRRAADPKSIKARDAEYSRRRRQTHKPYINALARDYYRRKPEVEEERLRRKVERDPDGFRHRANTRSARWRSANPDRAAEVLEQWRARNPERVKDQAVRATAKRRSLMRSLPHEPWTHAQVVARDGLFCWMCCIALGVHGRRDWCHDHLIPLSRADLPDHPGDTLVNIALACAPCNSWKRAKLLDGAAERLARNVNIARSGAAIPSTSWPGAGGRPEQDVVGSSGCEGGSKGVPSDVS